MCVYFGLNYELSPCMAFFGSLVGFGRHVNLLMLICFYDVFVSSIDYWYVVYIFHVPIHYNLYPKADSLTLFMLHSVFLVVCVAA